MPRANQSKTAILETLKRYSDSRSFKELLDDVDYSAVTLRTSLNALIAEGEVTVDHSDRPYQYKAKETI